MSRKLISILIPVFNEENNVRNAHEAVIGQMEQMAHKYDYEIVFTDNHSTDRTYEELRKIAMEDPKVKVVRFSHNYGFNRSLLTAYRLASGDAAIQLDCDLQDPPEMFETFLKHWEDGHDVVVGVRKKRKESFLLQSCRKGFYRFLSKISEDNLVVDGGDFRLVDRSILNHLKNIHESEPYVRGLISTFAANQIGIPYKRRARMHDESKFPALRLVGYAINGIVNHSTAPLRLASYCGFIVATITFLLAAGYLLGRFAFGQAWPAGFATDVILTLMGICLNAIFLGIIGEYLGKIYKQLKRRPTTVVESSINIEVSSQQGIDS